MVHDPTTVATCKPEARWAISSRRTRSDGTPNRARTAAHASTLARLQIVTCGQALPLGSASGLWLGTVNSPEKQNARRCERRAFSSAAVFGGMAETKLALDTAPRSRKRSRCGFLFDIRFRMRYTSPHVERQVSFFQATARCRFGGSGHGAARAGRDVQGHSSHGS